MKKYKYAAKDEELVPMNIKEIQLSALTALKKIDEICELLNIKYWGMYGTLLGAVRHQGFIPWDDDIDVAMKIDDYLVFKEYCISHSKELWPFSLDCNDTVKGYPFYIGRFCNNKYKMVFDSYNYSSGAFVDVYPYYGLGNEQVYNKTNWTRKKQYYNLLRKGLYAERSYAPLKGKSGKNTILNYLIFYITKIIGNRLWYRLLDAEAKRYTWDESDYIGIFVWENTCYKKEWYKDFIKIPFEDFMLNVPKQYDFVLRQNYGNYMEIPPADKRVSRHGYSGYFVKN